MIGDAAYAEQQRQARTSGIGFGSRMTGPAVPVPDAVPSLDAEAPAVPKAASPAGDLASGAYSAKEALALLAEVPARSADLYAAELARADGPRKTVLRALRQSEVDRGEDGDPALIAGCSRLLGE